MKMSVYVAALVAMENMVIDVPKNATKEQIVDAVNQQIIDGKFYPDSMPDLRYIEDNNTEETYYYA